MSDDQKMTKGTYAEHLGPFDAVQGLKRKTDEAASALLRHHGWTYTCQTPGSRWMWEKVLPDGRMLLVDQSTALMLARADACDRVADAEWGD